jgi:hypothetical protein
MADMSQVTSFPLQSKKLTNAYLKCIAKELGLPTKATREDLLQMVVGRLEDDNRQASNTQVDVSEGHVRLQDVGGIFLDVELRDEPEEETDDSEEEPAASENSRKPDLEQLLKDKEALVHEVQAQRRRLEHLWTKNCTLLGLIDARDEEIASLKADLESLHEMRQQIPPGTPQVHVSCPSIVDASIGSPSVGVSATCVATPPSHQSTLTPTSTTHVSLPTLKRKGQAPPVEPFSGDNPDLTFDDWLPTLERATQWNNWNQQEALLQLAGHLKGRARQEWSLLGDTEKSDYSLAVTVMRGRLDPNNRTLAAQDFRHMQQQKDETVADFMRRLERTFSHAYGKDPLTKESRDLLLYGQLLDGLKEEVARSPTVSGATTYTQLCLAAKAEERRRNELERRRLYRKGVAEESKNPPVSTSRKPPAPHTPSGSFSQPSGQTGVSQQAKRSCYQCGAVGHIARNCNKRKPTESTSGGNTTQTWSRKVTTESPQGDDPGNYLLVLCC